jgi:hypothetical protein
MKMAVPCAWEQQNNISHMHEETYADTMCMGETKHGNEFLEHENMHTGTYTTTYIHTNEDTICVD